MHILVECIKRWRVALVIGNCIDATRAVNSPKWAGAGGGHVTRNFSVGMHGSPDFC